MIRCRYFPTLLIVLLAVFNDGAMIALSKDRVTPSRTPNTWNLTNIFLTGENPGCQLFHLAQSTGKCTIKHCRILQSLSAGAC